MVENIKTHDKMINNAVTSQLLMLEKKVGYCNNHIFGNFRMTPGKRYKAINDHS